MDAPGRGGVGRLGMNQDRRAYELRRWSESNRPRDAWAAGRDVREQTQGLWGAVAWRTAKRHIRQLTRPARWIESRFGGSTKPLKNRVLEEVSGASSDRVPSWKFETRRSGDRHTQ